MMSNSRVFDRDGVPDVVVQRLPIYLRTLAFIADERDVISSRELGDLAGVSAAQVRKDLSLFGEFGRQGLGYQVKDLIAELERILQVDRVWPVILVGAGPLGRAIVNYRNSFETWQFQIVAAFDSDEAKVGRGLGHLTVQPMADLVPTVQEQAIEIGILAIPPSAAQPVADTMVDCGVRAILNYASTRLVLPESVRVAYIDPIVSLNGMTYYL